MGRELARRLKSHVDLTVFDRNAALLQAVSNEAGVRAAESMEELAALGTVILAVPDQEVINCIKDYNHLKVPLIVINIATNVAQHVLEETAAKQVKCIGVKFIGHADSMALGLDPVIIINDHPLELVPIAESIFSGLGQVLIGKADVVSFINTTAAEKALEAAVHIEEELLEQGITNPAIVNSAIRQVAAGIMKAYTEQDLGPFARQIIRAVRAKRK